MRHFKIKDSGMVTVLVITSGFDTHADVICPKIEGAGARVLRLDTDDLDRYEINLRPDTSSLSIEDKKEGKRVESKDIISVWYRRPSSDKRLSESFDEVGRRFFRGETKEWVKSITFVLKHCFWVTAPWFLYGANIKSNQLTVALDAGLSVPRTLVTKDPELVKGFYEECSCRMVAKPLKASFVESTDVYYTLRTQEIERSDLSDPSLYLCPTMFQEKIDTLYELRIVAIGRRLFVFKLTAKQGSFVDIRTYRLEDVDCIPFDISPSLREKIVCMLDNLDLPFSSMDFLVDSKEKAYFVDLNPNGQWLWLEFLTGVTMSDLFVKMLVSGEMVV